MYRGSKEKSSNFVIANVSVLHYFDGENRTFQWHNHHHSTHTHTGARSHSNEETIRNDRKKFIVRQKVHYTYTFSFPFPFPFSVLLFTKRKLESGCMRSAG